jgi:hypothetical protein
MIELLSYSPDLHPPDLPARQSLNCNELAKIPQLSSLNQLDGLDGQIAASYHADARYQRFLRAAHAWAAVLAQEEVEQLGFYSDRGFQRSVVVVQDVAAFLVSNNYTVLVTHLELHVPSRLIKPDIIEWGML